MKSTVVSICIFFACLAASSAEDCLDCGVPFQRSFVTDGQPGIVHCPLCYQVDIAEENGHYNFTWSKNGSTAHITTDKHARLHQDGSMMKFIPAKLEDSGYYQCVVWNSTYCFKKRIEVKIFKNDNGLCYNESTMYRRRGYMGFNTKVECANLKDYVDENSAQIQWYKECEPLNIDSSKFVTMGFTLIVQNVTESDAGNYTCETTYEYDGKLYNLSRANEMMVEVPKELKQPVILYPQNDSIEVELGDRVSLACNVSQSEHRLPLFWFINDKFAEDYDGNSRVATEKPVYTNLKDGTTLATVYLNISEVKKEDYENNFACILQTGNAEIRAYIFIKHPVPNFQGSLIAIFVALALVIAIAILTYKVFKIDIILWHRQSCLYRPSKEDGKIYDAYVMFPKSRTTINIYSIDTFVLKVLPEVLERQCGYKLFIFGRDDLPGEAIADVVDKAINESRRVIIVLAGIKSRDDFFEDAFEQQITFYDALVNNKFKTILIELEKIVDYANMPESIKYIKQKQGVIRWKGSFTDSSLLPDTRFWKNVRYRMPPPQNLHSKHSTSSDTYSIKIT